ncbi:MAG: hypothetical protein K2X86_17985 [Cytophagaceae bacterium]|nr:hypothetical protein [Cytophagaceae bacterium]
MNNRNNTPQSEEQLINTATIIFFALIAGVVVFATIMLYLIEVQKTMFTSDNEPNTSLHEIFQYIIPVLALSCLAIGRFLYNMQLTKIRAATGTTRYSMYLTALLIKYSLIEGPALFTIVAYMQTGNHYYMYILAVLLMYFISQKPSLSRFKEETEPA